MVRTTQNFKLFDKNSYSNYTYFASFSHFKGCELIASKASYFWFCSSILYIQGFNLMAGNKITKEGMDTSYWSYTKWARELCLGYSPLTSLYSLTKHTRFCEPGIVTFSRRHLLFVCRRTSRRQFGKNLWGSRQLRMLPWFSLIWNVFQF